MSDLAAFTQVVGEYGQRKFSSYFDLQKRLGKMTEELGEVAGCVNKHLSEEELHGEVGDLLVTLCAFAFVTDIDLMTVGDAAIARAIERWGP